MKNIMNRLSAVLIIFLVTVAGGTGAAQTGGLVRYVYDDNGRLRAVLSPAGEAAIYEYDPSGNITGISRRGAGVVSIISFNPKTGSENTLVTIAGTGFGANPADNTVQFNGLRAEVVSADLTQLVARAPVGVTTGSITVTTAAGSDRSADAFIVDSPPIIDAFSPPMGTEGTAVLITGSGFDPARSGNRVTINGAPCGVVSASPEALTILVPPFATSAPIVVTTRRGVATSTDDFIIPPRVRTPGEEIEYLGRLMFGQSKAVRISAPNKVGLLTFAGVAGRRANLQIEDKARDGSFITILGPAGESILLSNVNPISLTGVFMLPKTGIYSVVIDHFDQEASDLTLTLFETPPDVVAQIAVNGPPAVVNLTGPGQQAAIDVSGVVRPKVRVYVSSANGSGFFYYGLYKRGEDSNEESTLFQSSIRSGETRSVETATLGVTGRCIIRIFPPGNASPFPRGVLTVGVIDPESGETGTIAIGGAPVTAVIPSAGIDARFTFNGLAGQTVAVDQFGGDLRDPELTILGPDGGALPRSGVIAKLPVAGVYTLRIGSRTSAGSIELALYEIPADILGEIAIGAPPAKITIPTSGQVARLRFQGVAGQRISLKILGQSIGPRDVSVGVLGPRGESLGGGRVNGANRFFDQTLLVSAITLPVTGAYTLLIQPEDAVGPLDRPMVLAGAGSLSLTLFDVPQSAAGVLTLDGAPVRVATTIVEQTAELTLNGTAGQVISVKGSDPGFAGALLSYTPTAELRLYSPRGEYLEKSQGYFLGPVTLPETGVYKLVVSIVGAEIGALTLQGSLAPPDLASAITPNGAAVTVAPAKPGQRIALTFTGAANQKISLKIEGVSQAGVLRSLEGPGGRRVGIDPSVVENPKGVFTEFLGTTTLGAAGTYTFVAIAQETPIELRFQLQDVTAAVEDGRLTLGGPAVKVAAQTARENHRVTLAGVPGSKGRLRIVNPTGLFHLLVDAPDGSPVERKRFPDFKDEVIELGSMIDGAYTVIIELWGANASLSIAYEREPAALPISPGGPPVNVAVSSAGETGRLTFDGTAGQQVALKYGDISLLFGQVRVLDPGGQELLFPDEDDSYICECNNRTDLFSGALRLPTTGKYTVELSAGYRDPSRFEDNNTGGVTFTLYNVPEDVSAAITPDGVPVIVTTTTPGQNARITFNAVTGQPAKVRFSNNTIGKLSGWILKPWGALQTFSFAGEGEIELPPQTIATPGVYTILVDPAGLATGSVTVRLTKE